MPGREGGAQRRPHLLLDHVLVPVFDLEAAARRLDRARGLLALPGGRHPRVGTANMIVPLGRTYVELIAVVDELEAAGFPRSRRVGRAALAGRPFATWAARTADLDAFREVLLKEGWDLPPVAPGARRKPDGALLEWRTQELTHDLEPSVLPFVIEWRLPPGAHPAEVPVRHPSGAGDILRLRFTAPDPGAASAQLEALGVATPFEVGPGDRAELVEVRLESPAGEIALP